MSSIVYGKRRAFKPWRESQKEKPASYYLNDTKVGREKMAIPVSETDEQRFAKVKDFDGLISCIHSITGRDRDHIKRVVKLVQKYTQSMAETGGVPLGVAYTFDDEYTKNIGMQLLEAAEYLADTKTKQVEEMSFKLKNQLVVNVTVKRPYWVGTREDGVIVRTDPNPAKPKEARKEVYPNRGLKAVRTENGDVVITNEVDETTTRGDE